MVKQQYAVYHLFIKRALVYIGRSYHPECRRRSFEKSRGLAITRIKLFPCASFLEACNLERSHIAKYRPPFNKYIISSRAYYGKKHSKEVRLTLGRSREKSEAELLLISKGVRRAHKEGRGWGKGKHHKESSKRKISRAKKGHIQPPKARLKMSIAVRKAMSEGRGPGSLTGYRHPMWGRTHTRSAKRGMGTRARVAWKLAAKRGEKTFRGFGKAMRELAGKFT